MKIHSRINFYLLTVLMMTALAQVTISRADAEDLFAKRDFS